MSDPGISGSSGGSGPRNPSDPIRARLERGLAGRYDGLEEIGHGGMAIVFRAHDVRHGRTVALKVLRPELSAELSAERFQREIAVEARLNHPNVLTLLDSGKVDDLLFYVASWAEEGSLRDRLVKAAPLDLSEALRVATEVGEALAHAHSHGIVHRDVKPENVLFRSGHALLADFGIARVAADPRLSLTSEGLAIGTVNYMSPEQASGVVEVDGRSDQYSLGCVLYEMLSGDPPFTGRDLRVILARHQVDHVPSLEAVRPDVPLPVVAAIERSLSKRPQDRFATMKEFLAVLEAYRSGSHPRAVSKVGRRGWFVAAGVATAAVAVFLATRAPASALAATNVAVLPLEVHGEVRGDSSIGIGIAYLIEAEMELADPLRLIDIGGELPLRLRLSPEAVTMQEARRLARRANAAWILRGSVQQRSDSSTVILRLYSVSGDSLTRQVSATGAIGEIPLHQLGVAAVKKLLPYLLQSGQAVDVGSLRDQSAPAVALWMQGEARYRDARFGEAADFFGRALAADSTFALAAVKGAQARSWLHEMDASKALLDQALRFERRLAPRVALLARGLLASREGLADSAMSLLAAAERSSAGGWAEAAMSQGEAQYHLISRGGMGQRRAREAYERSRAVDSAFTPPLYHLAEMAIRDGRTAAAAALIARLTRTRADLVLITQLRLMQECVSRGATDTWLRGVALDPSAAFRAAKSLSVGVRHHLCAERGFRSVLANPVATDGERWGALLGVVNLRMAQGDNGGARTLIDSVVTSGKGIARSWYVLGSVCGAGMDDEALALGAFAQATFGRDYARLRASELLWVLSTLHRARNEPEPVRAAVAQLRRRADSTHAARDRMFANASEADLALVLGDTARAVLLLGSLESRSTPLQLAWDPGGALAPNRLLLAQLLLRQGRAREAYEATLVFDHAEPITFVGCIAPALRVRYLAASRIGDAVAAAEARRRLEALGRQDLLQ